MTTARLLSLPTATDRNQVLGSSGFPDAVLDWLTIQVNGTTAAFRSSVEQSHLQVISPDSGATVLLSGTRDQFESWIVRHPVESDPVRRVLLSRNGPTPIVAGGRRLPVGEKVLVLGILNASPDSFSDSGQFVGRDAVIRRGLQLAAEGVDIIEIGGMTAQPKKPTISIEEEIERVSPVLHSLKSEVDVALAVDTYRYEVAEAAAQAGAVLLNDIGGLADERLATLAATRGLALVVMHIKNKPKVDFHQPEHRWSLEYGSVVDEVAGFLAERANRAMDLGVPASHVFLDPGLGFDKLYLHDVAIMRRLSELRSLGHPIYLATSRKNYLGELLNLPSTDLTEATAAAVTWAVAQGSDIVRVHDVKAMSRVVRIAEFLSGRRDVPSLEDMKLWY